MDLIIAVKNIEASSKWYQSVLACRSTGQHIIRLVSENDEVLLCLHKWVADEHPAMMNPGITPGNGLILYFKTDNLDAIYNNAIKGGCKIEEDMHINANSRKKEFSLKDPDGYYLTVTEYHKYED